MSARDWLMLTGGVFTARCARSALEGSWGWAAIEFALALALAATALAGPERKAHQ